MRAFPFVMRGAIAPPTARFFCGVTRRRRANLVDGVSLHLPPQREAHRVRGQRSLSSLSTTDDDDMLVRMLVQDAFHPPAKDSASSIRSTGLTPPKEIPDAVDGQREEDGKETSTLDAHAEADDRSQTPAAPPPDEDGVRIPDTVPTSTESHFNGLSPTTSSAAANAEASCEATEQGQHSTATDARRLHATAEPFATVRRKASPTSTAARSAASSLGDEDQLEWMCLKCQTYNSLSSSKESCRNCGAPAAASHRSTNPPVRHVALMPPMWMCTHCAHLNTTASTPPPNATPRAQRSKFMCDSCGNPFTGVQTWTCPQCDHVCPRAATQCPTCFSQRPVQWTCRACRHAMNSVFSLRCRQCKVERPTRYSNALVRCAFCRDWNDARWELCATCMAPTTVMFEEVAPASRSSGEEEARDHLKDLRERWKHVVDPLVRDSKGLLHSKTVEGARQCSPSSLPENAARDGDAKLQHASVSIAARTTTAIPPRRKRTPVPLLDRAWWCSTCNVPQRRNASFCDICLQSRDHVQRLQREQEEKWKAERLASPAAPGTTAAENRSVIPAIADGDWRCPYCCSMHSVEEHQCCGHQREVPPGYWLCSQCGSTNRQDRVACLGCGQAQERVCAWTCVECSHKNAGEALICGQCGIPRQGVEHSVATGAEVTTGDGTASTAARAGDAAPTRIVCPVCAAPNWAERLACYRCRARLHNFEWTCQACGHGHHDRQATRCTNCKAFRTFDLSEEVWVCEVCSTTVYSGGELPVRTQCPKCQAARAATTLHFPARWQCPCGVYNRARISACPECGTRRRLPSLHTVLSCPHCFRDTILNVKEVCEHCNESLSDCFEDYESRIRADGITRSLRDSRHEAGDTEDGEDAEVATVLDGSTQ